jgi:hypothetical protein
MSRCTFEMGRIVCLFRLRFRWVRVFFDECGASVSSSLLAPVRFFFDSTRLGGVLVRRVSFPEGPSPIELEEQPLPSWCSALPTSCAFVVEE